MKINVTINTSKKPVEPVPTIRGIFRVPDDGVSYYRALEDVYSGEWFDQNGRPCPRAVTRRYKQPPYDGLPSTIQMWGASMIGDFFPLNEAWQRFWLSLIDRATEYTLDPAWKPFKELLPSDLLYWWMYATQESLALTDNHSAIYHGELIEGGCADYILKLNLSNPKPIAIKSLSMTGNIFKGLGKSGENFVIETINAGSLNAQGKFVSAIPPTIDDVWNDPSKIHWGVESTTLKLPLGGYAQAAFPPKPYGLPFFVMGLDGRNKIAASRVVQIQNGTLFSPYSPMPI